MAFHTDSDITCIPRNAFKVRQSDGDYYLALTNSERAWMVPGKAKCGKAWYGYEHSETKTDNFVWITTPPGYVFKLEKSVQCIPDGALKAGFQKDCGDLYVGVAHTVCGDVPCKVYPDGTCWYPYKGKEMLSTCFSWVVLRKCS